MNIVYNILASIDATELFGDDNVNWKYCTEHAMRPALDDEDACEFIVLASDDQYVVMCAREMEEFGCTPDFINAYKDARHGGATYVLFHAG